MIEIVSVESFTTEAVESLPQVNIAHVRDNVRFLSLFILVYGAFSVLKARAEVHSLRSAALYLASRLRA